MPTYIYETDDGERFETFQSMRDAPLSVHPRSGAPVRRVITGGLGFFKVRSGSSAPAPSPGTPPPASNCCPGCHD
jgi:predicted nucleic acid-binding Zn ribbon protein